MRRYKNLLISFKMKKKKIFNLMKKISSNEYIFQCLECQNSFKYSKIISPIIICFHCGKSIYFLENLNE